MIRTNFSGRSGGSKIKLSELKPKFTVLVRDIIKNITKVIYCKHNVATLILQKFYLEHADEVFTALVNIKGYFRERDDIIGEFVSSLSLNLKARQETLVQPLLKDWLARVVRNLQSELLRRQIVDERAV